MSASYLSIPPNLASAVEVRNFIVDSLRRKLIGPDPGYPLVQWSSDGALNGQEILRPQDPPRYRFAAGILFPNGVTHSGAMTALEVPETAEPGVNETEMKGPPDRELPNEVSQGDEEELEQSFTFLPSSIGISFLLTAGSGVSVTLEWATYEEVKVPGYGTEQQQGESKLWFRKPHSESVRLFADELVPGSYPEREVFRNDHGAVLNLHWISRSWGHNGERLVTITMLHRGTHEVSNQTCLYQCAFKVDCENTAAILPYPERVEGNADDEELSLRLLYRHKPVFAVGHGCAADWTTDSGPQLLATAVRTESMPVFEQAPIAPLDLIPEVDLSMLRMSRMSRSEVTQVCNNLANAYDSWIQSKLVELEADATLSPKLRERGQVHLANCGDCLARMRAGIDLLGVNGDVFEAFSKMNHSMVAQRAHYELASVAEKRRTWLKEGADYIPERPYIAPEYSEKTSWRPFQLAFVLMNLVSFADPLGPDRNVADIIWFPTGGGKTEAYLGLAAFAILHRRLVDPNNSGTTVLMRYTLRLLTTQQFQRAASLICSLELLRRRSPKKFGDDPITIGLWLGGSVTPNKNAKAVEELAGLESGGDDNKFIVLSCPWCGVDMGPVDIDGRRRTFGYERVTGPPQVRFRCSDPACDFHDAAGLPLEVVDERIYAQPPTLLIGTVDKFAMMPWQPEARHLFGIDVGKNVDPPDLVIQDELHLISGPLGSMVGHYETVIDELCMREKSGTRVGAKIVASTATISRAEEQVKALYDRKSMLFPPQGLRAGDSFFAIERTDIPGRLYVGVLASALPSHITAQVWTLSSLLQSPAFLKPPLSRTDEAYRDPYWTVMAYFNSLRELGRAATLIRADIPEHLNAEWFRMGLMKDLLPNGAMDLRRFINRDEELTSRLRSGEIPGTLQKLFTSLPSSETVDLCLATNMIQVGLDVPRLSLMLIVGQPKTASEYIQASSRVGRDRDKPGLVVTNFNPFKPRDRSHFESFRAFHESAYRHVEPTSVTPFAVPVVDRAIHALAVVLARYKDPRLLNSPAHGVSKQLRQIIVDVITRRTRDATDLEKDVAVKRLNAFLDRWDEWRPQSYGEFGSDDPNEPLLWPAGRPIPHEDWDSMKPTLSSMRSVDGEGEAYLLRTYPGAVEG